MTAKCLVPNREMRVFLLFLCLYAAAIMYLRAACWRHPTSAFFQPERAHVPDYSAFRLSQAQSYADDVATADDGPERSRNETPKLCVGIPSIRRHGISYLKSTLGSLQHGLTAEERESLYFVMLLAHTNQSYHPDFAQPWLENMADSLPAYQDDPERWRVIGDLERKGHHKPKQILDVSLVMEECARTNAPYTMVVEDDVVALDGWLHRTLHALEEASAMTAELGQTSFLYLRLFYYELLLGWNSEDWPTYLGYSTALTLAEAATLALLRRYWPLARRVLTRPMLLLVMCVCTPMSVGLFFAAGRTCTMPRPDGVALMSRYACCGQGLVFPRDAIVDDVLPLLREHGVARAATTVPVDSLIERYADARGDALRWALTPVVLQHVGGKSSHGATRDRYGFLTPNKIFNFGFESNDPEVLDAEHRRLADDGIDLSLDYGDLLD